MTITDTKDRVVIFDTTLLHAPRILETSKEKHHDNY